MRRPHFGIVYSLKTIVLDICKIIGIQKICVMKIFKKQNVISTHDQSNKKIPKIK